MPKKKIAGGWINEIDYNGHIMHIPFGSSLTGFENGNASWRKNTLQYAGNVWDAATARHDAETIKQLDYKFLNAAYVWGGKSIFGINCSGYTQSVYKFLNIALLHYAQQQATQGELVSFLQQAHCSDLVFFDDADGNIIHVGILLNESEIIHASGKVKIDKIDNAGIIDADTGNRLQHFAYNKKILVINCRLILLHLHVPVLLYYFL